jgi:ribosomal protein S18 acetylase RimI-like enzyme
MEMLMRPYAGDVDLPLIVDLIRAAPPTSRHLVDFPWRLSSPTLQSASDVRLWAAPDGTLVGFAAWQIWWAALDLYVRPGPYRKEVEAAIFAWAAERFRELDAERGHPLLYWAEAREDDDERLALLARHGYTLDDDNAYAMLSRPLGEVLPLPTPPAGFAIRPLAGAQEVDAYVVLHRRAFESASMTAAWRARTLRMPQYRPELDLVAVAPDGQPAGFCVGWLALDRRSAQIEPLGIDPAFQGQGLARALMLDMFGRFQALGAEQALVETESSRSPAHHAYESVGFRPLYRALRKGRWFSERQGDQS